MKPRHEMVFVTTSGRWPSGGHEGMCHEGMCLETHVLACLGVPSDHRDWTDPTWRDEKGKR